MPEFSYQDPFPLAKDQTNYRLLTKEDVSVADLRRARRCSRSSPRRLAFRRPRGDARASPSSSAPDHNEQVGDDPRRPRGVGERPRRGARAAAQRRGRARRVELPICQDTGTATVDRQEGPAGLDRRRRTRSTSPRASTRPTPRRTCATRRPSALDMYEEVNTGTNLPAQIDLYATEGAEYKFLFVAKGGGSANKTFLYQETKALLNPESLEKFLVDKMKTLGTAACPPYHLAVRRSAAPPPRRASRPSSSPRPSTSTLCPPTGNEQGQAFRDVELGSGSSSRRRSKLGHRRAVRRQVFRPRRAGHPPAAPRRLLPGRHGRLLLGRPQHQGQDRPGRALARGARAQPRAGSSRRSLPREARARRVKIDLNRPMKEILAELSQAPGLHAALAHRHARRRRATSPTRSSRSASTPARALPEYLKNHPVYYAGRPRPRRACPRARSARPPPAAWTPTSTCSSPTAARWS